MRLWTTCVWGFTTEEIEKQLDIIIQDIPVDNLIDIKFATTCSYESDLMTRYSALVIYKQ